MPWDTEWRWVNLSACHILLDFLSLNSSCLLLVGFLLSHPLFSPSILCSCLSHNMLSGSPPALLLYCFFIAVSHGQDKLRLEKQNTETLSYKCDIRVVVLGSQGTVFNFLCRVTVTFCCRLDVALSGIMYLLT